MSILRIKPVSAFEAEMKKSDLKRVLTRWGLTSLGIGAIIGGGIFTLTGIAAHDFAGPSYTEFQWYIVPYAHALTEADRTVCDLVDPMNEV